MVGIGVGVTVGLGAIVGSATGAESALQAIAATIKTTRVNEIKPSFMVAIPPSMETLRGIWSS